MTGNQDDLIFKCIIFKFEWCSVVLSINVPNYIWQDYQHNWPIFIEDTTTKSIQLSYNKCGDEAHCPTLVSFVSFLDPRPLGGLGESVYRVSQMVKFCLHSSFSLQFDEFFWQKLSSKCCWNTECILIEQDFVGRMEQRRNLFLLTNNKLCAIN